MTEEHSLCRVNWKLGQALMPDHFLWQEDSLRNEWESRFAQRPKAHWGVAELEWDETLLQASSQLLLTRLQLVFETGLLVDIPGNARPVSIDLPPGSQEAVDIYLHLESRPETIKGGWSDREGNFIELRLQRLRLSTRELNTPQPGFHLMRLRPRTESAPGEGPTKVARGWRPDEGFVPALISIFGLPWFGNRECRALSDALGRWVQFLRRQALENSLAVDKRVEARMCLRRARSLAWYLHQFAPELSALREEQSVESVVRTKGLAASAGGPYQVDSAEPALRPHPFDLYQRFVELYLDAHCYRNSPLDTLHGREPKLPSYRHGALAECFSEVRSLLEDQLERPSQRSPERAFEPDDEEPDRWVCALPEGASVESEVYFLVQFEGRIAEPPSTELGLDRRLLGLKLAAPNRLASVEERVLSGIGMERVRLVPFPHNFDSTTVQFYRLQVGPEWVWAHRQGAVCYRARGRPIYRSFLYFPDVAAPQMEGGGEPEPRRAAHG